MAVDIRKPLRKFIPLLLVLQRNFFSRQTTWPHVPSLASGRVSEGPIRFPRENASFGSTGILRLGPGPSSACRTVCDQEAICV